jgi:hypothetical protein
VVTTWLQARLASADTGHCGSAAALSMLHALIDSLLQALDELGLEGSFTDL